MSDRVQELEAAIRDLFTHQLSSSSGGDPGMIFDESDRMVESRRKGTVTFDREAVDRLKEIFYIPDPDLINPAVDQRLSEPAIHSVSHIPGSRTCLECGGTPEEPGRVNRPGKPGRADGPPSPPMIIGHLGFRGDLCTDPIHDIREDASPTERCPRVNCQSKQRWPRPRVMDPENTKMVFCDDDWHRPREGESPIGAKTEGRASPYSEHSGHPSGWTSVEALQAQSADLHHWAQALCNAVRKMSKDVPVLDEVWYAESAVQAVLDGRDPSLAIMGLEELDEACRIVSPGQLELGHRVVIDDIEIYKPFKKIRQLPDGNWIVMEPK